MNVAVLYVMYFLIFQVRNPWGNETEWNGAWSDGSAEWGYVPDEEKERIGLNFDNDGEFWMSYKDWRRYFDQCEVCRAVNQVSMK